MIRFAQAVAMTILLAACQTSIPPPATPDTHSSAALQIAAHITAHMTDIANLATDARQAAENAADADSVDEVRREADSVFGLVWGQASGLLSGQRAAQIQPWKSRWQVSFTDFDPAYGVRYGDAPPTTVDPSKLGIAGRGRHVRRQLLTELENSPDNADIEGVVRALNDVIGWTRIDDGVTKAERQPRIDLTYRWDAPKSFWQGDADTGWLFAVQAQSMNILKTDYAGDLETARRHAADLLELARKVELRLIEVRHLAEEANL